MDSDRTCPRCKAGLENFCPNLTLTFNSPDEHLGGVTYGGYSDSIVVDERFVLRVPANLNPARARRCFAPASQPSRRWAAGVSAKARRRSEEIGVRPLNDPSKEIGRSGSDPLTKEIGVRPLNSRTP